MYKLHLGDCREILKTLLDNSIDSIVCDPPYELGFMGKLWDNSGISYDVSVWRECLRVLKPGGHLIAFGGSRTYHRLAVAIEDAGFQIRDSILWIYGSGFPKSLDVSKALDKQAGAVREVVEERSFGGRAHNEDYRLKDNRNITAPSTDLAKQWQGWGTAVKPAFEPAVLARKPLIGTVADNVATWGTGAINVDATRIAHNEPIKMMKAQTSKESMTGNGKFGQAGRHADVAELKESGRWPANVILDEDAAKALDEQSGGNVSRFFYIPKASKAEREAGLDGMEQKTISTKGNGLARTCEVCGANTLNGCECENRTYSNPSRLNHHPTVKPLELMKYLVRLITPTGGTVLDPFMGSGTTGCACAIEGFNFVGIDIEFDYVEIAKKRIEYYLMTSPLKGI